MASANKIIPHYTYDDYVHWKGQWELIEGHPIAMSPLPLPRHQHIAGSLIYEFKSCLKGVCKNCKVYPPLDYKTSDDTILQPDVLIVCKEVEKPFLDFPPALVVEILSPSTKLRDRNTKYSLYEEQGIRYYLIVDADRKTIEIYQLVNGKYELKPYAEGFEFDLDTNCSISPKLDNVWE